MACCLCGGTSVAHEQVCPLCGPWYSWYGQKAIAHAFIFTVTVAALPPTNLLSNPTGCSTEIRSTGPSAHATDSTALRGSRATYVGPRSQASCINKKKAKNCAQKHMDFPGRALRWERESAGAGNTSAKIQPPPRDETPRAGAAAMKPRPRMHKGGYYATDRAATAIPGAWQRPPCSRAHRHRA